MNEQYEQINLFALGKKKFKIEKPIRLIELFAGIGSQAMALRDLGTDFEHYKVVEFDKYAIKSYNAIHRSIEKLIKPLLENGIIEFVNGEYHMAPGKENVYKELRTHQT